MTTRAALVGSLLAMLGAAPNHAQPAQAAQITEREEFLYVLNPPAGAPKDAKVALLWIPSAVERYCLGKSREQCAAIDYCVRTTTRNVPMCRNLPVDVTQIPKYAPDLYPRRVLGVTYFQAATIDIAGLTGLYEYMDKSLRTDFDRLSLPQRIKARIRVKRSADDDDFDLLEVVALPK